MPRFSQRSKDNLAQTHPLLQKLMESAITEFDFTVICGQRGREEQEAAYRAGKSRARFGQSPHNFAPSLAVDIVPYPLDWNDLAAFNKMGAVIKKHAKKLGINVTWGKDFKTLKDYPHFELTNWRDIKGPLAK